MSERKDGQQKSTPIQMGNGREMNNNEQRKTLLMMKKTYKIKKINTGTVDILGFNK